MRDPERVERLWLVLAVATLWLLAVGGAHEGDAAPARRRRLSVLRQGWNCVLAWLLGDGAPRPAMRLVPEPWPTRAAPAQPGPAPPAPVERPVPPSAPRKFLLSPQETYP